MAASKDRVRFLIGERYFRMPSGQCTMAGVMMQAFGITAKVANRSLHGSGVWVTCRLSQFALFMIHRNKAGITNGFMDLHAELVSAETGDMYGQLASRLDVSRADVKKVVKALGFGHDWVVERVKRVEHVPIVELDVSANPG